MSFTDEKYLKQSSKEHFTLFLEAMFGIAVEDRVVGG
jgi:hypothetical protein